ncbi:MAG TPA: hypothetical protein VF540_08195 [Segetibacter sp.]|jgi:hypothetical protein
MNKPDLLELECNTPDGRGSILSLHPKGVVILLNRIEFKQEMKGRKHGAEMHYFYPYEDVEIIKGQYNFK